MRFVTIQQITGCLLVFPTVTFMFLVFLGDALKTVLFVLCKKWDKKISVPPSLRAVICQVLGCLLLPPQALSLVLLHTFLVSRLFLLWLKFFWVHGHDSLNRNYSLHTFFVHLRFYTINDIQSKVFKLSSL